LGIKGFDTPNANRVQNIGLAFDKALGLGIGKGSPEKDQSKNPKIK
jgi:hypothetical protein